MIVEQATLAVAKVLLYNPLSTGLHANYDGVVFPAVSATFNTFANTYATSSVQFLSLVAYAYVNTVNTAAMLNAIATLTYAVGLVLWVFAVWDKRNSRAILMLLATILGGIASSTVLWFLNNPTKALGSSYAVITNSTFASMAFSISSSALQAVVLIRNKRIANILKVLACCVAIGCTVAMATIIFQDSPICNNSGPCTLRMYIIVPVMPIVYALFCLGIWSVGIWSHWWQVRKLSMNSKINMVSFFSFSYFFMVSSLRSPYM